MLFIRELGKLAVVAGMVLGAGMTATSAMATELPPVGVASGPNHERIIARAIIKFRPHNGGIQAAPIEVILAPFTQATFSDTELLSPVDISNSVMPFGNMQLTELLDNDLVTCGVLSDEQCTRARVRVYTTGAGAGFWNTVGGYGAPLSVQAPELPSSAWQLVGLDIANAAYMSTTDISLLNVLNLSDMYASIIPQFDFRSDFRLAGAGTYSATIVMEVVLDDIPVK